MRATLRALLSTLFALPLLLGPVPAHADTADPAGWPRPRFLSYNVCGAASHCPPIYGKSPAAWRDMVVRAMDYWDADLVMLQEVCYLQWTTLRNHLQSRTNGPKYDSIWAATRTAPGCGRWDPDNPDADLRFGLVIFAKGAAQTINNGSRVVYPLPETDPSGTIENRIMLCARAPITGRLVRACNTHIAPGALGSRQIAHVATLTREFAAMGDPVVLAGDFNVLPHEAALDPLYNHSGGRGVFQEVDENDKSFFVNGCAPSQDRCRSGEATAKKPCSPNVTHPGKIDYIFLSYYWFTTVRGDAAACAGDLSDHHLLRGAAAWEH
ncbi:endonuclease/exonuclease/phosphatase family protein [Nonomuraea sp. PA05]|uniref:endonuclease/exonuclease/phosphatase family protein n=1 Tax=Nonomuraea sp. PA05 TaxID=2604466 RepID=UPI0011D86C48|nr:endonuclease/exonuclease/phosphatase family protein [Nonomuraea sp. PA05]TYB47627.1 endonuclease/exonuclease/phosphatase family protein [Nonomuraea sp. PA05]